MENPRLRPIGDLLNENFYVPRYQRGYRWGEQEIKELLDDVLQYYSATQDRSNRVSKFYCLQPVVVKKKSWKRMDNKEFEGWELIDGQQRLTTIFLILNYLEDVRKLLGSKTDIYTIDFETRENCTGFFQNQIYKDSVDESNVDFYHISRAYKYIKGWFEKYNHKLEIHNTLLKSDYNVAIIWYEAFEDSKSDDDNNSIELFTRLNDGKIPLTDAELIKALLLQSDLYPSTEERFVKQRLFEIATEWDEVEAKLQDEKMWYFINDVAYQPSSKIEFIFKLLADKWNGFASQDLIQYDEKDGKPKHFEFLVFDKHLSQKRAAFMKNTKADKDVLEPINEIWEEIKQLFGALYDWYNDHSLFHYIGYLLVNEKNKEELIRDLVSLEKDKDEFESLIKQRIAKSVKISKKDRETGIVKQLNEIAYGEDNTEIIKVLLLFNIETLVRHKKENARFPFHLFKKEKITSIEHIHPQNSANIDTDEERAITWLRNHKRSLQFIRETSKEADNTIGDLPQRIDDLIVNYDKDNFKSVFEKVIASYHKLTDFKENELHTLYNLALIDKDTNSQLNNSFFDVKREILKENKSGRYIPICTQHAFSKYHSQSPKEMMFWNNEDRKSYYNSIEVVYNSFVQLLNGGNDN